MKKFKVLKKEDLTRAKMGELFKTKESFFLEGYPGGFTLVHLTSEDGFDDYRLEAILDNCADSWPDLVVCFESGEEIPVIAERIKPPRPGEMFGGVDAKAAAETIAAAFCDKPLSPVKRILSVIENALNLKTWDGMAELGRLKEILATIERLKANDFRAEIDRLGGFLKENFREDLAVGDDYVGTAIRLLKELKKNRVAAQEILQGIFSPVPVVGKEATSPYDDKAEYALRSMAEIQKRMSILGLEPWTSPQGGPVEQIMKYLEGYQRLLAENIRLKEEHKAHIEKMRSSNYLRQIHRLRDYLLNNGVLSADSSEDIVNAAISMLDNDKNDLRRIRNDRDDLLQKLSKAQDKIKVLVETLRIYQHEEGRLRTLILEYFPNEEVPLGYTDTAIDLLKKVKNRGRMVAEIKVNLDEGKTAREAAEIALRELGEHPAQKDLDRLQEYMNSLGWDTPPQNPVTAAIEGIEHLRKINKDLRRDDTITAIMKELDGKKEVELTLSLDNEAVARCIMDLVRKTNKGFFKRIRGL